MRDPNYYAASGLDRAAERRGDRDWLRSLLAAAETRVLPLWQSQNLVQPGEAPRAVMLRCRETLTLIEDESRLIFLGIRQETALFAADLSHLDEARAAEFAARYGQFLNLRAVGALMPRFEGSLLAYARGLMLWHARHRFCGVCGGPTEVRAAGHQRVCASPACGASHFPRTDPAVIMLVSRGDRALLGRKAEWAAGMYSTLAGFVETGESLEEAVAREVLEESGITVTDVEYHSSQPWPFPASIMLGFTARALDETIRINAEELEDARWFTRAELTDGAAGLAHRPRSDSIARRLIDDWIARG